MTASSTSSDGYYSSTDVCLMAGCTARQLDYWCRAGAVVPAIPASGSGNYRRWSARDVWRVRVITRIADTSYGWMGGRNDRGRRSGGFNSSTIKAVWDALADKAPGDHESMLVLPDGTVEFDVLRLPDTAAVIVRLNKS